LVDGQGARPGIPLAEAAGERYVRDHRGNATAEKINESYVGRVLRLTLLAPDIVEAILDGRQPAAAGRIVSTSAVKKSVPAQQRQVHPDEGRPGCRGLAFWCRRQTVWVAVNDALKPLGAKVRHQPFTPERILDALARARIIGK
jgi:hypothetical protein